MRALLNEFFRKFSIVTENKHRIFGMLGFLYFFEKRKFLKKIKNYSGEVPEVTFVLSVYGNEKYLRAALDSINALTYPKLHLFIYNDKSPDGSRKIIDEYKFTKEFLSLKVVHSEVNRNIYLFNFCIEQVSTEFVIYGCDDDIQLEDRVEMQVFSMINDGAYFSAGDGIVIDGEGRAYGRAFNPLLQYDKADHLIDSFFSIYSFGATSCFRKQLFEFFGPLDGGLREIDFVLPFRTMLMGRKLVRVPMPVIKWRKHASNMSGDNQRKSEEGIRRIEENKASNLREFRRLLEYVKDVYPEYNRLRDKLDGKIKKQNI